MKRLFCLTSAIGLFCAALAGQTSPPGPDKKVALIIGNDGYQFVTPLRTAVNDARAVQSVLHANYGFETTLLTDATRAQIMAALSAYRRTLGPRSSLLVYYAGHGYQDKDVDKAYWWPVDARPDDVSEWISADDITTAVKAISARHVLIVSDSCFSGTLSRGITPYANLTPDTDRLMTLTKLRDQSSRELLASGGNEPVADGGAGNHSVFAGAFLRALQAMPPGDFAVEEIFHDIRESVGGKSSQLPQLDPLRNSGHDGGSFVFTRVADSVRNVVSAPAPAPPPGARAPAPVVSQPQTTASRVPTLELKGIPGFKPIPDSYTSSALVFNVGESDLVAQVRDGSISVSYKGTQLGEPLSCPAIISIGISVVSSRSVAVDAKNAVIPNVERVAISSPTGSVSYYSTKKSADEKKQIRQALEGLCSH